MKPAIRIRDLRVRRGGHLVLPDVSLELPAQRVIGLLGPSGSGKTTLIRAIVGVQIVEAGSVDVSGLSAGSPLLEWVSWGLPMTYAYDALSRATTESDPGARLLADVAVVAAASLIALALGAATLRRRTP